MLQYAVWCRHYCNVLCDAVTFYRRMHDAIYCSVAVSPALPKHHNIWGGACPRPSNHRKQTTSLHTHYDGEQRQQMYPCCLFSLNRHVTVPHLLLVQHTTHCGIPQSEQHSAASPAAHTTLQTPNTLPALPLPPAGQPLLLLLRCVLCSAVVDTTAVPSCAVGRCMSCI